MRIITSGSQYLDIDAYGGCIAYAELLQKLGTPAKAVSTAPLNQSIPPFVLNWHAPLVTQYTPSPDDTYTLIDVSAPDYFDPFVTHDRIDEIIDHHPGLEEYWRERLGDGAVIEQVGAACTQVFERWEAAGLADQISETSARLLMCGILDNTLNFGADITTDRDHHAYAALSKRANWPGDLPAQYFGACQQGIMANIAQAVVDDTKVVDYFKTYPQTVAIGQLAVWDAKEVAHQSFDIFKSKLGSIAPHWFMNVIGVSDNKSYFVSDVPEVQVWLADLLSIHFEGNTAIAPRAWLRKEIIKADIDRAAKA
jgi:inorganic pyrophosphatase/exopolyphosphatase